MAAVYHYNGWGQTTLAFNTTGYAHLGGQGNTSMFSLAGGETQRQLLVRVAGDFSKIGVQIPANTIATSATTVNFRKNVANGNQTISIGAGLTGFFQDASNSDTVASGDKVNLSFATPNTSGSLTCSGSEWAFAASSGTTGFLVGGMIGPSTNGLTRFNGWNSNNAQNATEASAQATIRAACTLRNLCVNVQTARGVVDTLTARINTASGTLTKATTASTTGFYEDTTHSDSVADGDLINYQIAFGSSASQIILLPSVQVDFSGSNQAWIGGTATSVAAGATSYSAPSGGNIPNATEANTLMTVKSAGTLSRLAFGVITNTVSATSTVKTRKNSANGSQSVSVTAGATGAFEDTTNSDTVADGDTIGLQIAAGAGGTQLILGGTSLRFVPSSGAITGDLSVTLGAATSTAAGTVEVQGALSKTLGAATTTAAGTVAVSGTSSATLSAATSTAAGTVAVTGGLSKTLGASTVTADGTVTNGPTGSDRKSTRLNSSHVSESRMPSSA